MKCKWYEFHKWIDIRKYYTKEFEGSMCEYSYVKYRVCKKCGTITERVLCGYVEMCNRTLTDCEAKIVMNKCTYHNDPSDVHYKLRPTKPPTKVKLK